MKKGVFMSLGLGLLFLSGLAFAQPSIRSVETIVIDDFDTVGAQNYQIIEPTGNTGTYSWTWGVQGSRFAMEGYPKLGYFDAIPNPLRMLKGDFGAEQSDTTPKVMGVKSKFNRKGDNWFEVFPLSSETDENGNPKTMEIPFKGQVTQIDFWVWGANYNYYLDLLVRDAEGRVHVLPAGSLKFYGWRNLIIKVPSYVRQSSLLRSGPETMTFLGFRVSTDKNEYVDDYVIYFDQVRYISNALTNIYDGYELRKVQFEGEGDGSTGGNGTAAGGEAAPAETNNAEGGN